MVEVIAAHETDGRAVFRDLRWGVYVTFDGPTDYARACFREYGLKTDETGRIAAMYKPYHLIGLELGVSVASAVLRGEPTGQARDWRGDAVAVAKKDLAAGEMLDGEGGYCVWGQLCPAGASLAAGALPIGLAHGVRLKRAIPKGQGLRWDDVDYDRDAQVVQVRRDMERRFADR